MYNEVFYMEYTNIRVTKETRQRLREIGQKQQTYDEIINKVLNYYDDRE